jgi:hypothetical protein
LYDHRRRTFPFGSSYGGVVSGGHGLVHQMPILDTHMPWMETLQAAAMPDADDGSINI